MNTILTLDSALALLIVAVLLVVFFVGLNIYRNRFLVRSQGGMHIVEQLPVGPRQRVVLIETQGRKVLLAVGQERVSLLESWKEPNDGNF